MDFVGVFHKKVLFFFACFKENLAECFQDA